MECPRCHSDVDKGSRFCPQCGCDLKPGQEGEGIPSSLSAVENPAAKACGGGGQSSGSSEAPLLQEDADPSGAGAEKAKPKGKIAASYVAGIVVTGVLCAFALALGIFTTVKDAQTAQVSSQSLQSSSGSAGSSSEPSSSQSDAEAYLSDAQDCSNLNSSNTLSETNGGNAYDFSVTGTSGWQAIMTCVAKDLYMPSSVQAKIRDFINKDITSGLHTYTSSTVEWNLQDGSSIYATYTAPLNGNGGWVINFSNVNPEVSDSSNSQ